MFSLQDKTTGKCAAGVCAKCCNAFIPADQCAACIKDQCPHYDCKPDAAGKCAANVCPDCCNAYIPAGAQCDACVASKCTPTPAPTPAPTAPAWTPVANACFEFDAKKGQGSGASPKCAGCGLVVNTVTVASAGVATGTLNYTGTAWGNYGQAFSCINMAYQYDNATQSLSFPNAAKAGSIANKCLQAWSGPPGSPHKCHGGTYAPPSLSRPDDFAFGMGLWGCVHKNEQDPNKCAFNGLIWSNAITNCAGMSSGYYQFMFAGMTGSKYAPTCQYPFRA